MITIIEATDHYFLHFEYDPAIIRVVKCIKGAKWNSDDRVWEVPKNNVLKAALGDIFERYEMKYEILSHDRLIHEDACVTHLTTRWESEIERFGKYLILKGYSPKTIKNYLSHGRRLMAYCMATDQDLDDQAMRAYALSSFVDKSCSRSYVSQSISAYKNFMKSHGVHKTLNDIPRPKRDKLLPKVLSQGEVIRVLKAPTNLKHKALLFTIYASGLRVSEAACLKVCDVETDRMMIRVEHGKGSNDRYTLLSETAMTVLKTYIESYRPK